MTLTLARGLISGVCLTLSHMAYSAPGKAHREDISVVQLMEMFPAESEATAWFMLHRIRERGPVRRVAGWLARSRSM